LGARLLQRQPRREIALPVKVARYGKMVGAFELHGNEPAQNDCDLTG